MTSELDKNFKRVFSFELLLHRIENTKSENQQYSKILLEKTLAGLDSRGKITIDYNDDHTDYVILPANPDDERAKGIARKLTSARSIYKELAQKMGSARSDVTGRSWTDGQILEMCHLIDAVIYPVAISEELLDMRETLEDFASQYKAAPPADDISEQ